MKDLTFVLPRKTISCKCEDMWSSGWLGMGGKVGAVEGVGDRALSDEPQR